MMLLLGTHLQQLSPPAHYCCSYQQTRVVGEAVLGGTKVMNYVALPCAGNV